MPARFRGTVQGERGEGSRLGHRFITTDTNGWNLGVNVDGGAGPAIYAEEDHFTVYATGGSNESRQSHMIARVEEVTNEDLSLDRRITLFGARGEVVGVYTV
jgi:hypothetical protein